MNIPKDSELRGVIKELNTISNNFIQKAPGNISIKIAISVLEAYLNTPEGWPEKKETIWGGDNWNDAIDQCNSAAMKGCPCCGVARIVEKQPTVEWIKSLKKNIEEIGEVKLDLRVLPVLEKLLARLKEKQAEVPTVEEIVYSISTDEIFSCVGGICKATSNEDALFNLIAKAIQKLIKSKQKGKMSRDAES